MSGTQLPPPPTDRPDDGAPPLIALDRALTPLGPGPTPPRQAPTLLLTTAVIVLAVLAAALGALVLWTVSERGELAAENEGLLADNERLTAENERLGAANAELADGLRGWEEEFYGPEEFEAGDRVALFTAGPVDELSVANVARFTFDAQAGTLFELVTSGDGGEAFSVELVRDGGRFVGSAEVGSYPEDEFWGYGEEYGGYGPSEQAWFVLDQDGSYELTVYAGGRYGADEEGGALTARLHAVADGLERVVDISEPYPTDGELPIHTFEGQAGQLAIITMTSERPEALDPFVRLYDPDGALIGQDDDGAGNLDARLVVRLPETGIYEVEADAFDEGFGRRSGRENPYTLLVELAELS